MYQKEYCYKQSFIYLFFFAEEKCVSLAPMRQTIQFE